MKLLKRYLKKYRFHVIIGPLFKQIEVLFELIVPLVMKDLINVGIMNKNTNIIFHNGIILIILAFVGFLSTMVCQYLASQASQGVGTDLRKDLYDKINNLSFSTLDSLSNGKLLNIITTDVNQVQAAVAMIIRLLIRAPFLVIGSIILAIYINVKISFIFILASILIGLIIYSIMKISVKKINMVQVELDEMNTIAKENLSGTRVIRAFRKEHHEQIRFEKTNTRHRALSINVGRISSLLNPLSFVIVSTAITLIIYYSGVLVNNGNLTMGDVYALTSYMTQIFLAILVVANLVNIFNKAFVSSKRIWTVLNLENDMKYGNEDIEVCDDIICFDNVSYAYLDANEVIKDVSFTIKRGQNIGIIGGTGSGKSTLLYLLSRFYDPSKGMIYLYNKNIKDYKENVLRKQFSFVLQKNVLYTGTIKSNMLFGKNYSDEKINEALELACAKEFVNLLPKKINTQVLRGGKNFSGGEKQRLCIAQAIIQNKEILILDDSFSALDYKTDSILRNNLKKTSRTIISVSQRVSSIKDCDKILVMHNGCIVGMGTHEELIKNCIVYQEINHSQESSGK